MYVCLLLGSCFSLLYNELLQPSFSLWSETYTSRDFYKTQEQSENMQNFNFISDTAVANQLTFLILVCGYVKFQERVSRPFQQNFLITAQGDKWKIVSDCFRLQEPVTYVHKTAMCLYNM